MNVIIDQGDTIYRYRCNEQCDNCSIRYICWTNKKEGDTLRLGGRSSYLDLLMVRTRLDFLMDGGELLCPWCYRVNQKDVARKLGATCSTCGYYITCEICNEEDCQFRDDLYNIDGDCLMTK